MGIDKAIIVISFAAARVDRIGVMNCANPTITRVRALQAALKVASFSQRQNGICCYNRQAASPENACEGCCLS